MSVATMPSPQAADPHETGPTLAGMRVRGGVTAGFARRDGATRIAGLIERDGYRMRLPRPEHGCEGVIINTGGGIAGGDFVSHMVHAGPCADVLVTAQSAERIYRAPPDLETDVAVSLKAAEGARLAWVPQETIVYSGAHVRRWLSAIIAADAQALFVEMLVLGRRAHGERVKAGDITDHWRIWRAERLVFAESVRLHGDMDQALARSTIADGCHVVGFAILVAPDAEERLHAVRRCIADAPCRIAASAFDGMLVVRGLAREPQHLKAAFAPLIPLLAGRPTPRVWQT